MNSSLSNNKRRLKRSGPKIVEIGRKYNNEIIENKKDKLFEGINLITKASLKSLES